MKKIVSVLLVFTMMISFCTVSFANSNQLESTKTLEKNGITYEIKVSENNNVRIVETKGSDGFVSKVEYNKKENTATLSTNKNEATYELKINEYENQMKTVNKNLYRMSSEEPSYDNYTSEYYRRYSYIRDIFSNGDTKYELDVPEDSAEAWARGAYLDDYNSKDYRIKQKGDYFINQLETADKFTKRIEGAIASNMPGDGFAITWGAIMEQIVDVYEDYSTAQLLNLLLSLVEAIPGISLGAAAIESLTLGPVVAANLWNCRRLVDEINNL